MALSGNILHDVNDYALLLDSLSTGHITKRHECFNSSQNWEIPKFIVEWQLNLADFLSFRGRLWIDFESRLVSFRKEWKVFKLNF